jgi:hypothetical protein
VNPYGHGTGTPDVRQIFQLDDGTYVLVFMTGETQSDGTAFLQIRLETGNKRWYWLNSVVAIGHLHPLTPTQLTMDAWQVSEMPSFRF